DLRTLSDGDYALCVRATPQSGGTLVAMTSGGTIATLDAASGEAHVLGSLPFAGDEVEYEPLTGRAFLQGGWPGEGFELSLSTLELGPAIPSGTLFEGLEWVEG